MYQLLKKTCKYPILFVGLFLYPITSYSQIEIENRIRRCWQAFSEKSESVALAYVKLIEEISSEKSEKSESVALAYLKLMEELSSEKSKHSQTVVLTYVNRLKELSSEQFETKESYSRIQNIIRSIRENKTKIKLTDAKIQKVLLEILERFNSEKHSDITTEILLFFEDISQDITTKTARRLASELSSLRISPEEKIRIIKTLKERKPKDILTIQVLATKGLNNSDPNVRVATIEALGSILEVSGFLKRNYSGFKRELYQLVVHPIKSTIDFNHTVNDIIGYVLQQLMALAQYDSNPDVKKTTIKAMVKIDESSAVIFGYAMVIDTLIEIISSNSDSDVKKEAISALEERLKFSANRNFYQLSIHTVKERKDTTIRKLTIALYHKNHDIRKAARIAFRALERENAMKYYNIQDLKAKELEKRIDEYQRGGIGLTYDNSNSQPPNRVPPPFESWFEVEVFLRIHNKGYIVLPQYVTSDEKYRIDLVIINSDKKNNSRGTMLAVEADGFHHNNTDRKKEDEEKQKVLENEGWSIWRVKHSEEKTPSLPHPSFYLKYTNWRNREINPEALDTLWEELERKQIKPVR